MDWDASKYVGLTLAWHYDAPTPYVVMSMFGYVVRSLKRFGVTSSKATHAPPPCTPPVYGRSAQPTAADLTAPATATQIKWLQEVVGVFLYHARALRAGLMTLCAIHQAASAQSSATQHTVDLTTHLLQHMATHYLLGV